MCSLAYAFPRQKHDGIVAVLEGAVTLQFEDVKGAAWAGGVTRTVPIIEDKRWVG